MLHVRESFAKRRMRHRRPIPIRQRPAALTAVFLIVCMLGACATTHTVETTEGKHIQVREAGGFLEQPVTIGGYLALTGVSYGVLLLAVLIAPRR